MIKYSFISPILASSNSLIISEFDKYGSAQSDRLHNRNSEIIRELEDAKIGEINEYFIIQFCAT